ncbi:hypothetical protein [Turicimonas muris]|uniref:hypothetical protein n=1 Tax=Turicimonas muris TaxID=1796652 RepID=UPI0024955D40|nr:hypothetical protein [Turicimonas muris]
MNSIFNQSSTALRSFSEEELISWIRAEGFYSMPPIIQVLVEHLETHSDERICYKDAYGKLKTFLDKAFGQAFDVTDKLDGLYADLQDELDPENERAKELLKRTGKLVDAADEHRSFIDNTYAEDFIPEVE